MEVDRKEFMQGVTNQPKKERIVPGLKPETIKDNRKFVAYLNSFLPKKIPQDG